MVNKIAKAEKIPIGEATIIVKEYNRLLKENEKKNKKQQLGLIAIEDRDILACKISKKEKIPLEDSSLIASLSTKPATNISGNEVKQNLAIKAYRMSKEKNIPLE